MHVRARPRQAGQSKMGLMGVGGLENSRLSGKDWGGVKKVVMGGVGGGNVFKKHCVKFSENR